MLFVVEDGKLDILWIDDELMLRTRASYAKNGWAGFYLYRGEEQYRIRIAPDRNRGRNLLTGEEYDVSVLSLMKHSSPGGH